jgi:hypothetical protein
MHEMGFAPWAALTVLYGVTLTAGALAVAAVRWPAVGPPAALLAVAGVLYVAPRWLYEELRLVDRGAFLPLLETRVLHNHVVHALYDGTAAGVAFLASRALAAGSAPIDTPAWAVTGLVAGVTLAGFKLSGLYRGSYREAGLAETARAFRAVIVGGVLGAGAAFAVLGPAVAPAVLVLFLYFLLTLVVGARFSFRVLEYVYQRAQRAGRRALIVGADRLGGQALAEMLARPELGFQPVGFVDDNSRTDRSDFQGYPVRAVSDGELAAVLRSLHVSDLVVPVGSVSEPRLGVVGEVCRAQGVRLVHFAVRWSAGSEPARVQLPAVGPAL